MINTPCTDGCGQPHCRTRSSTGCLDRVIGKDPKRRVAVIGGGVGGVTTAYFLEGVCDVEIFEARSKVGGHCDSQIVEYQGQQITVDLGAQFFHPATHPLYVKPTCGPSSRLLTRYLRHSLPWILQPTFERHAKSFCRTSLGK
jgi:hypothetical protein